ncbi:5-oxoprolinase subunit B family protein [Nocardia coubleae]|uniref:Carboxyltransferase domain-containing protein n=1 Tax=Nocardia coubleae TaxID=356147 RepID=A0A846W157_9NOCA|nr:carboxyltransferase domain-containing protein [Nocardia coubleae]NKX86861.1 carboxyltransferase domain-containing protein [Nocardia coubleae]
MSSAVVLRSVEAVGQRPITRIRQAGDHQLLVEYGDMTLDLTLNLRVHALRNELDQRPINGVTETAPGFRSLMIGFDPTRVDREDVLDELVERQRSLPELSSLVLQSRVIELPIAFDDEMTRQAVQQYRITTRPDAPNVVDGDNVDYIVRYNGFTSREEFYTEFLATTWWNAFIGYFPGLPSLFALDPRTHLSAPKYNPARMWTAEGAVGIGGPCVVLYPIESPGGYQLFGRTVPIGVDHLGPDDGRDRLNPAGTNLFHPGDRVRFTRVTERELLALRQQVFEGTYRYRIEEGEFVVAEYLAMVEHSAPRSAEVARARAAAAARVEVP